MVTSIQVFVQVPLLFCLVTASMGGITDLEKAFSQLENKVNVQQEEIKSLHQIIEQLEKRLEPLEVKGRFEEIQDTNTICIWISLLFMPATLDYPPVDYRVNGLLHCMSLYVGEWQESIHYEIENINLINCISGEPHSKHF